MVFPTPTSIRRTSIRDVTWIQGLEILLFAYPPVIGVGMIGILEGIAPAQFRFAFLAFGTGGYLVIKVGVPLFLYFDARSVSTTSGDWTPNEWLYMIAGAAISAPLVAIVYLHRRYRHVEPRSESSRWRYVVALSLVLPLAGITVAVIGVVLAAPSIVVTGLALAGTIALGVFPASIYKDAAYVRTSSMTWRPNPGTYLGLAFLSIAFAPFQPVVASYYLVRRHTADPSP